MCSEAPTTAKEVAPIPGDNDDDDHHHFGGDDDDVYDGDDNDYNALCAVCTVFSLDRRWGIV